MENAINAVTPAERFLYAFRRGLQKHKRSDDSTPTSLSKSSSIFRESISVKIVQRIYTYLQEV